MWPFSYKKNGSSTIPGEFHERLNHLESDFRLLKTEWHEVYDKLAHALDRERKRRKKMVDEALDEAEPEGPKIDLNDPVQILAEARKRGL